MKPIFQIVTSLLTLLLLSGCGTLYATVDERIMSANPNGYYPATKFDKECINAWSSDSGLFGRSYLITTLFVLDYPLSVVSDTIFLPVDFVLLLNNDDNKI